MNKAYHQELELLRQYWREISQDPDPTGDQVNGLSLNPSLKLRQVEWRGLTARLKDKKVEPAPGREFILTYYDPAGGPLQKTAADNDLLAIKIMAEGLSPAEAARQGGVPVGTIDRLLQAAVDNGLLLRPPSAIRRPPSFPRGKGIDPAFMAAQVFTLQWHITQSCDLHCRHCYDRSPRPAMPYDQGLRVLDDLREFCLEKNVRGQVSFTGGNPLLYPHFLKLYQAAVDRNLQVAILGNPADRGIIEKICAIQTPIFYQVSLEGLAAHNDYIRGAGHFQRLLKFLTLLQEFNIYSVVMLTLTRANMEQVLPLAELLRSRADEFTYNRLAMVGEGANLQSVRPEDYENFAARYLTACRHNNVLRPKDNLQNIIQHRANRPLFGGCAGYGCGAAFNFFAILPDGEAHACRKLPSYIGNAFKEKIGHIYDGEPARRYRQGSEACAHCDIRPVCGGCLAVSHGFGLNIFTEKDPCCFL